MASSNSENGEIAIGGIAALDDSLDHVAEHGFEVPMERQSNAAPNEEQRVLSPISSAGE
jgi:hypothetical protein